MDDWSKNMTHNIQITHKSATDEENHDMKNLLL